MLLELKLEVMAYLVTMQL